jgi:exodeoxyribonuclease VII large subunit
MAASLAARQRDLGRLARADGLLAFPWKLRERREAIAQSRAALVDTLERRPGHEAQRLARASTALRSFARVAELSRKRDFLSALARELQARMARTIGAGRSRLGTAAEKLHLVSPLAVLARGYAIAWKDGKRSPILSADEVRIGDGIRVRLHEGEIRAVVRQGGVRKSSDLGPLFATETPGE